MRKCSRDLGSIDARSILRQLIAATITTLIVCSPSGTLLADTRWTPSIILQGERNDNIEFTVNDPADDYVYLLDPKLEFDYRQELTRFNAAGDVIIRRYQDNDLLDDEIYRFDFEGQTNFTERFRLRADYKFVKDTTLDSELEEVGRIFFREDRLSNDARLAPSFNLSERTSIGLAGRYRNVEYDSDTKVDYTRWDIGLPVRWRLESQIDTIYINPGYTDRKSDSNRSKSFNFRLGWNHETTERLTLQLSVGARYTEHEVIDTGQTDETWSGLGDLRFNYDFETGSLRADFKHDLRNTANGDQVDLTKLILRLRWNFTERIGMDLRGRYYYTITEGQVDDDTSDFIQAGSSLFYHLTENHDIFVGYEYSQEDQKDSEDDERAERNQIWAGIRLNFP